MKWWVVVGLVTMSCGSALAGQPYLIYVDGPDDRLVRRDLDGTDTPIGEVGALGYASVQRLMWFRTAGIIYGYDFSENTFISINPETSVGTFLTLAKDIPFWEDDASLPSTGQVLACFDSELKTFNPTFGAFEDFYSATNAIFGAAYIEASIFGGEAFYLMIGDELYALIGPDWKEPVIVGFNLQSRELIHDPSTGILYGFNTGVMYRIDVVTGSEIEIAIPGFPSSHTLMIDDTVPPCPADANGDGVIDPLDTGFIFARFGCTYPDDGQFCQFADTNSDGLVDPLDVGFAMARFGDCPQ